MSVTFPANRHSCVHVIIITKADQRFLFPISRLQTSRVCILARFVRRTKKKRETVCSLRNFELKQSVFSKWKSLSRASFERIRE